MTTLLNDTQATILQQAFQPVRTARAGDFLVELQVDQAICEDRYADTPERIRYSNNTIYTLRRITKITKTSVYTRADPGESYHGAYYMRFQGLVNALGTVFPPNKNILCPCIVSEATVRELLPERLNSDYRFRVRATTLCMGYDQASCSSEIGCARFNTIYYTTNIAGLWQGFCKSCWDQLPEALGAIKIK